jgi:hypothetical protein
VKTIWTKLAARRVMKTRRQNGDVSSPVLPDKEEPLRDNDIIRLYHGFRDQQDAVVAARHGISGQDRIGRTYSYEANNNPVGLFVSTDLETAKEFAGAVGLGVIMEFNARVSELEAPVWPGGGYTVQGEMPQSFGAPEDREKARLKAREKASEEGPYSWPTVQESDRPELADSLMASREFQALFTGHLNPNMISAFWVTNTGPDQVRRYDDKHQRISRNEFLKMTNDMEIQRDSGRPNVKNRQTMPNDEFDGQNFFDSFVSRFGGQDDPSYRDHVHSVLRDYASSETGDEYLLNYVWPKQLPHLKNWLKENDR